MFVIGNWPVDISCMRVMKSLVVCVCPMLWSNLGVSFELVVVVYIVRWWLSSNKWRAAFGFLFRYFRGVDALCDMDGADWVGVWNTTAFVSGSSSFSVSDKFAAALCLRRFQGCSDSPDLFFQIFTSNNAIHSHQTRHHNDIHINHRYSETVSRSFICRCPEMWLKLPIDIKYSATHDAFKHKIKQHYIGKY